MPLVDKPAAEVDIDEALARALLRTQHADVADRPLRLLAAGWDNVVYRLGDDLTVRLPRRALAAELVANELRWLPGLAERLPLPIAAPVRAGVPSSGPGRPTYPFDWSICRWIDGVTALESPPVDPALTAEALGSFLGGLHQPAPDDAPANRFRGVPLETRHDRTVEQLAALADVVDAVALRSVWDELVALPRWSGPPVWLHGDLHPGNLVVDGDGRIAGVIDFGDVTAGDPATDLAVAWMLLPAEHRHHVRGTHDDDTWGRARGWALALGLVYLAHSADAPAFATLGHRTLAAVLAQN